MAEVHSSAVSTAVSPNGLFSPSQVCCVGRPKVLLHKSFSALPGLRNIHNKAKANLLKHHLEMYPLSRVINGCDFNIVYR